MCISSIHLAICGWLEHGQKLLLEELISEQENGFIAFIIDGPELQQSGLDLYMGCEHFRVWTCSELGFVSSLVNDQVQVIFSPSLLLFLIPLVERRRGRCFRATKMLQHTKVGV